MEGRGGERKFPIGFRFKPKDEELVEIYLLPKLQGRPTVPNDAVIEANVYEHHPDTLTNLHRSGGGQEEWYFLSSRQRMYGNGVRPARKTRDGRGRWKASTATKEVAEEVVVCNGNIKFCKSVLNYFEGVPKKETRSKWIMLELTVPEFEIKLDEPGAKNMLDEYVMCKIYVSPQHKKKGDADDDDEEEGTSSAFEEEEEEASSSSTPHGHGRGTAECSMLAEKQTSNKRPMVEQLPQRDSFFSPAQKQARHQGSLSIGSTTQPSYSAATSNNAASSMQAYYGRPGQLAGAHCGLRFQEPPPTQRPAGAYNGQAPATQPPAGVSGGRGLVQQLPTPTQVMYQPFADPTDGGDPFGRMAATMTRPTTPASQAARLQSFQGSQPPRHPGTAFRPQVSLQCCYDQNYRPVQAQQRPPGNASSSQLQRLPAFQPPRQQMQQPFLNGGADRRGGVAAVPRGQYYNGYPYQRTSLAAADGQGGAANERINGAARFNVNAEQFFVDLATINPSLAGGFTQPAPARPIESPSAAPRPAAGVANVKTETGETSSLNTQDAA